MTRDAGEKLLALAGKNLDELLTGERARGLQADRPGNAGARAHAVEDPAELETRNVAAMIPGSDPKLKDEYVIYSAHWDHLGIGTPVNGDAIYNGADRQRHRLRDSAGAGARVGRAAAEAETQRAVPFGDGGGRRAHGVRNTTRRIRWFRRRRRRSI